MKRRIIYLVACGALLALALPSAAGAGWLDEVPAGDVAVTIPSTVTHGTPFSAQVDAGAVTPAVSPVDVVYLVGFNGTKVSLLATGSAEDASATLSASLTSKTSLRAIYGGDYVFSGGSMEGTGGVFSAAKTVAVRAKLGAPTMSSRVLPLSGKRVTLRGTIAPKHATGSRPVTLLFEKRTSSGWKPLFSFGAKVTSQKSGYSVYEMELYSDRKSDKGSWRVRARHGDSAHATGHSGYTYFVCR